MIKFIENFILGKFRAPCKSDAVHVNSPEFPITPISTDGSIAQVDIPGGKLPSLAGNHFNMRHPVDTQTL